MFLTDLRLLHTLAPNTSNRPRVMVTQRFFREFIWIEFAKIEAGKEVGEGPGFKEFRE